MTAPKDNTLNEHPRSPAVGSMINAIRTYRSNQSGSPFLTPKLARDGLLAGEPSERSDALMNKCTDDQLLCHRPNLR
jgi:hypothetical protein